jgi:Fe-S cluster assembly ATPase SufC
LITKGYQSYRMSDRLPGQRAGEDCNAKEALCEQLSLLRQLRDEFDKLTLLVGPNGGGKSTLFDLLYGIRHLIVDNAKVGEVFPPEDLTAWVNMNEQSFELRDPLGPIRMKPLPEKIDEGLKLSEQIARGWTE